MQGSRRGRLVGDTNAAVAPTVALSLFGLVAAAGLAFDYARMAALDTELQQAADQAALAAASQLDQSSTSCSRAVAAARQMISNRTVFANDRDADGVNVTIPDQTANNGCGNSGDKVQFYSAYTSKANNTSTTSPAAAKFVSVTVKSRQAVRALTPIVAMLHSDSFSGRAVAGLGSGICKAPPMMICAAAGFPSSADVGKGVRLQPGPNTGAWAPGNYGYLDFGSGASGLATNLGSNQQTVAGCYDNSGGLQTEPGNKASVTKALNTRFDIYEAGTSACDAGSGDYCPSDNTTKDFVKKEVVEFKNLKDTDPVPANPGCGAAGATVSDFEQRSSAKGFTRDTCHINGSCTSNFGNGTWDVATYFAANHPSDTVPSGAAARRYDVYLWEKLDKATRLATRLTNPSDPPDIKITGPAHNQKKDYTYTNYCAYPQAKNGTAVVAGSTQKDRRVMTVAAVDCTGLSGKGSVKVAQWVDMFLVEPSWDRTAPYSTGKSEIYAEIIGVATKPDGSSSFQYYSRNRPYLVE